MKDSRLIDQLPMPEVVAARLDQIRAIADEPIVVYGAGGYSVELRTFLASLDLDVAASVVDAEFLLRRGMSGDTPVSPEEIARRFPTCRLVVAFTGDPVMSRAAASRLGIPGVRSIEVIDCWRWREFDEWRRNTAMTEMLQPLYEALADDLSRRTLVAFVTSKLTLDPTALSPVYRGAQYFPADLEEFAPRHEDRFVDGGAFNGDTLAEFRNRVPDGCRAYLAFEPDRENRMQLESYLERENLDWVSVLPYGLWRTSGAVPFTSGLGSAARVDEKVDSSSAIDVVALDDLDVAATVIKLDIEGAEREALEGARGTITSHGPRLSIAAYHRLDDLIVLPDFITSVDDSYAFYLRQHDRYSNELVLYATRRNGK